MNSYDAISQYSPEWWTVRRGIPTASNFHRIMTAKKLQYAAGAKEYAIELIADLYDAHYGQHDDGYYQSAAMKSGDGFESESRRFYEFEKNASVRQVGFCIDGDGRFGCSPDGLIGSEGGLEAKNPQPKTHLAWLMAGGVPDEHKAQVHGSLIVTGFAWWDFVSYCPGLPPLIVRTVPDEYTETLRGHLETFWDEFTSLKAKVVCVAGEPICDGGAVEGSMFPTAAEVMADSDTPTLSALFDQYDDCRGDWELIWQAHPGIDAEYMLAASPEKQAEYVATFNRLMPQGVLS